MREIRELRVEITEAEKSRWWTSGKKMKVFDSWDFQFRRVAEFTKIRWRPQYTPHTHKKKRTALWRRYWRFDDSESSIKSRYRDNQSILRDGQLLRVGHSLRCFAMYQRLVERNSEASMRARSATGVSAGSDGVRIGSTTCCSGYQW